MYIHMIEFQGLELSFQAMVSGDNSTLQSSEKSAPASVFVDVTRELEENPQSVLAERADEVCCLGLLLWFSYGFPMGFL